jgi:hypothetical protein
MIMNLLLLSMLPELELELLAAPPLELLLELAPPPPAELELGDLDSSTKNDKQDFLIMTKKDIVIVIAFCLVLYGPLHSNGICLLD